MSKLLGAELKVIRKRKASWVILGFLLAFLVLGYLMVYFFTNAGLSRSFLFPGKVIEYTLFQLGDNGIYLAAIFGGLFFGSPFSWRTYETRFIQRRSRDDVFLGKVLAGLVVLGFWLVIGLASGHLISFSLGLLEGNTAYAIPGFWLVLRGVLLVLVVWFSWFMLAGTIALWSKSTAMGIGFSLGYYFIEGVIFSIPGFRDMISGFYHFFVYRASSGTIAELFQPLGNSPASLANLLPVIFGYLVGFVLLSWWRFRTMEVSEH
jgi:ABC-type transport system involved in multi-copper enzyme maturation permease subunit